MIKLLHTGDLHLDSSFSGLSDAEARARRAGLRRLVSEIIDIANEERVELIIFAGDQFDAYPVYPETEEAFLHDLSRARCPVVLLPGNHDPYTAESPYRTLRFPDNVHVFTSDTLTCKEFSGLSARIYGAAYTSKEHPENLLDGFVAPSDDVVNIIALHGSLDASDGCAPFSAADIARTGADYVALGHIHKRTEVLTAGHTSYAYCGCPEGRAFDEAYDTGILIGTVSKDGCALTNRRVSDIRYRELTLDIGETGDIAAALPKTDGREFLRLTLVGECESPDTDALYDALCARYERLVISDRTTAPRNLWNGLDEDGLRGMFLRSMKSELDACTDEQTIKKLLRAVELGIGAIENRDI